MQVYDHVLNNELNGIVAPTVGLHPKGLSLVGVVTSPLVAFSLHVFVPLPFLCTRSHPYSW